jgi:NADH:ubiquinone oxidoreductase subunit 2 (subunit N)
LAPILAAGLSVALLSLAGIPPFVGFFAKLAIHRPAHVLPPDVHIWLGPP